MKKDILTAMDKTKYCLHIMVYNPEKYWIHSLTNDNKYHGHGINKFYWIKAKNFYDRKIEKLGNDKLTIFTQNGIVI